MSIRESASRKKRTDTAKGVPKPRGTRRKAGPPPLEEQRMDTDYDPPPEPRTVPVELPGRGSRKA